MVRQPGGHVSGVLGGAGSLGEAVAVGDSWGSLGGCLPRCCYAIDDSRDGPKQGDQCTPELLGGSARALVCCWKSAVAFEEMNEKGLQVGACPEPRLMSQ